MKKILRNSLLVTAALAMGMSAWAQKDVTSQYITNATLANGLTGWTNENFNTPVKGNNTIGYASESYAGWGELEKTSYSLKQDITLPAGSYTLVSYSFYREGEGANTDPATSRAHLIAGDNQMPIATLGSIKATGYANSQAEGANVFDSKMYRNALDFTLSSESTITIGLEGTFEQMRSWIIAGMFELIDNDQEATMESPFDVTGYITNPGFEYRDLTGWEATNEGELSNGYIFQTQSNTSFGSKAGGFYAEAWQAEGGLSDRKMTQTVNNIPNGLYQLSFYANYGGEGAYIKANNDQKNVEPNKMQKYTVSTVVTDGTLTIEIGLAGGSANYFAFDRVELLFSGDITASLAALRDQAQALASENMNAEAKAALNDAIAATASPSDYLGAIDLLSDAINAAKASAEAYDKLEEAIADVQAFATEAQANGAPAEAAADLDAIVSDMEAGSIADNEIADIIAMIPEIAANVAKQQTAAGSDMTRAIINPSGDLGETGWSFNKEGGNCRKWQDDTNNFFEYWSPTAAAGAFSIEQTLYFMPSGTYTLSAKMFNSLNGEDGAAWVDGGQIGIYGNQEYVLCDVEGTELNEYVVDNIVVGDDHILVIGATNFDTMSARWFGVDDFKLTLTSDGTATGISEVKSAEQKQEGIFNLQGQRVSATKKGLYIIDGKKVMK